MSTRVRMALAGLGVVVLGSVAAAYAAKIGPWHAGAKDQGPILARVDGTPIYLWQATSRIQGLSTVHGDVMKTLGANWRQRVLESLVNDVIVQEEADRRHIQVTPTELNRAIVRLQGQIGTQKDFDEFLAKQSIDLTELDRRMRLQLLTARVYEAVTADVTVPQKDIESYYRSHKAQYKRSDGKIAPLVEVQPDISDQLTKEAQERAYSSWLAGRRAQSKIEVLLADWKGAK